MKLSNSLIGTWWCVIVTSPDFNVAVNIEVYLKKTMEKID